MLGLFLRSAGAAGPNRYASTAVTTTRLPSFLTTLTLVPEGRNPPSAMASTSFSPNRTCPTGRQMPSMVPIWPTRMEPVSYTHLTLPTSDLV